MSEVLEFLREKSPMSVGEYVEFCLFDNRFGYYKRDAIRTGKEGDFYTSQTLNSKLFASLLLEGARSLAHNFSLDISRSKIVEIGAEPNKAMFENSQVIGVKDELSLNGNLLVFSNELLDARPFERFSFSGGKIEKMFVDFSKGEASAFYENANDDEVEILRRYFPSKKSENFVVDFSFDALKLLKKIVSQNWKGVLVFADYFRSKSELLDFGKPTGRIYKNHKASSDIFLTPTECDITFSPLDEPFLEILNSSGFVGVSQKTQSAFFMEFAQGKIREVIENSSTFSEEKRALSELLTPMHLGEFFRIIYGVRF